MTVSCVFSSCVFPLVSFGENLSAYYNNNSWHVDFIFIEFFFVII